MTELLTTEAYALQLLCFRLTLLYCTTWLRSNALTPILGHQRSHEEHSRSNAKAQLTFTGFLPQRMALMPGGAALVTTEVAKPNHSNALAQMAFSVLLLLYLTLTSGRSALVVSDGEPPLPALPGERIIFRVTCSLEQLHLLLGCGQDNDIWTPVLRDLLRVSKERRVLVSEAQFAQRARQR